MRLLLLVGLAFLAPACAEWRCDASTCSSGCCDSNGTCVLNGGNDFCGRGGKTCSTCNGDCATGVCKCPDGLELVAGKCRCTSTSCATGCCEPALSAYSSDTCRKTFSSSYCGTGGATCTSCSYPNSCSTSGVCGQTCKDYGSACTGSECCASLTCQYDSFAGEYRCRY